MIEEGSVIGSYLVQDRIGQGASAIVHRAWNDDIQRTVAMKFLPLIHQPLAKSRFVREAKALRRLDHPNVVQVLDTGEAEGTPFMVFDFIPGGSLSDRMAAEPLTHGEALTMLDGIAKGLDYAHRRGIVHRDVKPANVLINSQGSPVIADFGLARLLEQPTATATGMFAGTPAYMSPEQAEGGDIGPAADQYSLAAMAYEMIAGQVPFPGDTVSEVLTALLTKQPPPPSSIRTGLSPEVDAAILRGLSKHPGDRWPTCQAMVDAILAAMVASLAEPAMAAAASGGPERRAAAGTLDPRVAALSVQAGDPYLTIVMPYSQAGPKRGARRWLLAAVAAAAILGGSVVAGVAWTGDGGGLPFWGHPTTTAAGTPATP